MKNLNELDKYRIRSAIFPATDHSGAFKVFVNGRSFQVIASVDSIGSGIWEHVSVVPKNQKRCPTWDEMCAIKDMFFNPEEECIQYHPKHSKYVNYHEYCLHIWRPADGNLRSPVQCSEMETLEYRDDLLEDYWADLADIPVDPDTDKLEEPFMSFPAGTDKEDVWRWFDERHSKGVAYLLYHDGVDRTDEMSKLYYLKQLCDECHSYDCCYNHSGICRFAMVHERKPHIHDDGCLDYDYKEGEQ